MHPGFCPRRLGRALSVFVLSAALAPTYAASTYHGQGLSIAPAGLVAAIARTQARAAATDPALAIGHNGCAALKAGPKGRVLSGCFTRTGPAFAHGKQEIGLHLVAWGRAGQLRPVTLRRSAAKGNRVDYRGKQVSEWWRVLPIGYEQGFTIAKAPAGTGEVVLQLKASRAPTLEHGTLAWGPLRYGKLHVVDAAGHTLPAHLEAQGRTISLAFDARHAQYPVTVDPTVWLDHQALPTSGGSFGYSVAFNTNGTLALVGAPTTNTTTGAAYVYTLSNGTWTQTATLTASGVTVSDFGVSVALSGDGTTALVGTDCAPYTTSSSTCGPGAAFVFTQGSGSWTQAAELSYSSASLTLNPSFGRAVALNSNGTIALVGAETANSTAGAAYVFTEPSVGGWATSSTPTATLAEPSGAQNDDFGISVALDGAGATALVGADGASSQAGAAYVFTQPSVGGWASTTTPTATLTASGGAGQFGTSVALDTNGTTALVGANGGAYVFTQQSPGTWAGTASPTDTLTANTSGEFGYSVALDSNGTTALVGGPYNGTGGACFLFAEPSSGWAATATPTAAFADPPETYSDEFGYSVALDGAGTTALVGAWGNSPAGAAYVFEPDSLSAVLNVPASVTVSTQYSAYYIVTNNGASTSGDVKVQMPVPSGASYAGATSTQGTCTYDSAYHVETCDLGDIPGGGSFAKAVLILNAGASPETITQTASLVGESPNLAKSGATSVTTSNGGSGSSGGSSSGGGGAIGLWALLGLLGLAGAMRATRRG